MQTYYGNVKSVLVLVGLGMIWAESVLYQVLRVHKCRAVFSDHKFTHLRGLQYVVTQVGTSDDPHYNSWTDPGKLFLEMSSECSSWLGKGMRWGQTELN